MMGKCSTRGCGDERVVTWPLMGNVGLCGKHYDRPTAQFAGLVEESRAPPDDFDIPEWDLPPLRPSVPRYMTAPADIWVTKDGLEIPIRQLEDSHLINILRMLQRIQRQMDEVDDEGLPKGDGLPIDVKEMWTVKFTAVSIEVGRRGMHG